jgi:hypothetical protein
VKTDSENRRRLVKTLIVGGALAAAVVAVPAAYAATAAPPPAGFVTICKAAASPAVTGSYTFTVSGIKTPVTVAVGKCSAPIKTTDRRVTITETAKAGFAVSKIATKPEGRLVSADLKAGKTTVKVPAGNVTSQTVVTFTNRVVPPPPPPTGTLQVCKVAGPGVAIGQVFKFTVGTAATSVAAGKCSDPIKLPVGNVTVKETATVGLKVSAIAVTGTSTLVSSDLATGTAVVKIAVGASKVSFTNLKPGVTGCVRGDGYYKNHEAVVAKLVTANGGTLLIGGVALTAAQIHAIYERNSDNFLDQVSQKLITARLNQLSGASTPAAVQAAIDAAQALEKAAGGPLKGKATPKTTVVVGGKTYTASELVVTLASYNGGTSGGPTSCA